MNQPALPAYLMNRNSAAVAERATAGIGGSMPPHISIQGNTFTLVDASGNEHDAGNVLDACIADVSDVNCKQYFENDWTPGSNEPPTCWSANGIAPSREASKPQSSTCESCQWNVRGSDTSKISGAAIKACRDEKWLAILLPKYPDMMFQLKVTPGSFKNWKAFIDPFLANGNTTDVSDVLTRISFLAKTNGVLTFQAVSYIDEGTYKARELAAGEKKTDALVGRNDIPIAGALVAPAATAALPAPTQQAAPQVQQPAPFVPPTASPALVAATTMQPTTAAPFAATAQTVEAPKTRKRRNTTAQPETLQPANPQPAQAPFRPAPEATLQPAASPGAAFGIQPGVQPNAEMTSVLAGIFGKAPA